MVLLKCSNTVTKRETISSLHEQSPRTPRWKHLLLPAQIYHQTWKGQQMSARMGDSLCSDFLNGLFGGGGVVFPDSTNWLIFLGVEIFQEISSASPNCQVIQLLSAKSKGFSDEWSVSVLRSFGRKGNLAPTILFKKISISEVPRGSGHCCSSFLLTFSLGAYWASQL